jgi:D-alanyl-lipoteichoic acid acyltransferase DltB (MBOAT superfamily)
MSFSSVQFLFFFPVVTMLYFVTPAKLRWALLLVASCVFYMAFIPIYILILGGTIVVDYFAGLAIAGAAGGRRRAFLLISLVANIGALAVFKYYNFFIENVTGALALMHLHVSLPLLGLILPIGLSFHTFHPLCDVLSATGGRADRAAATHAAPIPRPT